MSRFAFPDGRNARAVMRGVDQSQIRPPTVVLPHFNAIPSFIAGSPLISTDTALMRKRTTGRPGLRALAVRLRTCLDLHGLAPALGQ